MKKAKFGKLRVIVSAILSLCLVFSFAACGEEEDTKKITLNPATITVAVGGTQTVQATLTDISGDVTWTSDNDAVATVAVTNAAATTRVATVTGVAAGETTIKATAGGKTATCSVTVTAPLGGEEGGEGEDGDITITLNGEAVGTAPYNMHVNGTLEFAATAPEDSTVQWESSAPTVASVVNGLVTGLTAGDAVITAKISDTVKATVSVNVAAPTTVANGGEASFETGWRYWFGDGAASVSSCVNYANDNETQITYTFTSGQFYSVQLFYKDKYAYTDHDVSLTIVSPIEAAITVNGEKQELSVGENEVTVEGYTGATLLVAFGVEGESIASGTDLTFAFKNLVVTSNADVELVAPTFSFDAATKVITIDDANEPENVEKYTLGLFNSETDVDPAYTIDVTNNAAVNFASVPTGNYVLKLRAVNSSNTIVNSPWSATSATFEWSNEKTPLVWSEEGSIADESATWYYYAQNWEPVCSFDECYIDSQGDIHVVGLTGNTGNSWSFQLFYKATFTSCTMTVQSSSTGIITINGTQYELTADTPRQITLSGNTKISIQFGANVDYNTNHNLSGNITLSDITFN